MNFPPAPHWPGQGQCQAEPESHIIWNLATPDIHVYVDIEDHDIDGFFDIEYSNFDIDVVTVFDIVQWPGPGLPKKRRFRRNVRVDIDVWNFDIGF